MKAVCPHCGSLQDVDEAELGLDTLCAHCGKTYRPVLIPVGDDLPSGDFENHIELEAPRYPVPAETVFLDVETTGLMAGRSRIIEITLQGEEGVFSTLVNPGARIPWTISSITGLTNEMVADAPSFAQIAGQVAGMMRDHVIVGHNVTFDLRMIFSELARAGIPPWPVRYRCTLATERKLRGRGGNSLCQCLERRDIHSDVYHRSRADVESTIRLYDSQLREGAEVAERSFSYDLPV